MCSKKNLFFTLRHLHFHLLINFDTKTRINFNNLSSDYNFTCDLLQMHHTLQGESGSILLKDNSSSNTCTPPKFTLTEWFNCMSKITHSKEEKSNSLSPLIMETFYQTL